jgi:hypothetical protein
MKTIVRRGAACFLAVAALTTVKLVATSTPAQADEVYRLRTYETTYSIPR